MCLSQSMFESRFCNADTAYERVSKKMPSWASLKEAGQPLAWS